MNGKAANDAAKNNAYSAAVIAIIEACFALLCCGIINVLSKVVLVLERVNCIKALPCVLQA